MLSGCRTGRGWFLLCEPEQPPAALPPWHVGCGFSLARCLVAQTAGQVYRRSAAAALAESGAAELAANTYAGKTFFTEVQIHTANFDGLTKTKWHGRSFCGRLLLTNTNGAKRQNAGNETVMFAD